MSFAFVLLACGLVLLPTKRRQSGDADLGSLPLALDLVATALRAGQAVPNALDVAAPAAPRVEASELRHVAALLRLGADPAEAWAGARAGTDLAELGRVASRSTVSGARLADAFNQSAQRLRRAAVAADEARAHRAGVLCAAPLALCFLPSFVCLGIIPTLIGLARSALHTGI